LDGANSFNQGIENWNVSRVINTSFMFRSASTFNQPIENWDVGRVSNMLQMFASANSFNQPIENWNVSRVTSMRRMFENADAFNQCLGSWALKTGPTNPKFIDDMLTGTSCPSGYLATPSRTVGPWCRVHQMVATLMGIRIAPNLLATTVQMVALRSLVVISAH
jgi:surface protein